MDWSCTLKEKSMQFILLTCEYLSYVIYWILKTIHLSHLRHLISKCTLCTVHIHLHRIYTKLIHTAKRYIFDIGKFKALRRAHSHHFVVVDVPVWKRVHEYKYKKENKNHFQLSLNSFDLSFCQPLNRLPLFVRSTIQPFCFRTYLINALNGNIIFGTFIQHMWYCVRESESESLKTERNNQQKLKLKYGNIYT